MGSTSGGQYPLEVDNVQRLTKLSLHCDHKVMNWVIFMNFNYRVFRNIWCQKK